MDFEETADELYGLPPSEFTAARDARVAAARAEGDRETAAALKTLRRPSVGAWLANQIVRESPKAIDHLLAVAEALRDAQATLDGDAIRRLSAEGRDAVAAVVSHASELARKRGQPVSSAALAELETTLDAAMADTDVAGAVRGGRLTSALRYSGMGLVDAMARSPDRRANRLEGRTTSSAADRELQRAAQDLERAQAQLHDAERAVTAAETTLAERRDVAERAGRRVREAKEAVRRAKTRIGRRRGA